MRIVIALGGNALLRRSDPATIEVQRRNVAIAAEAIAPLAAEHSIVVVHGNGPQVGLLSLLPPKIPVATLLTMIVVDPGDPAFASPTRFVGPVYPKEAADALAAQKGWTFRPADLAGRQFAAGSMGPKVEAAARFAWKTGGRAAIGSLADIAEVVAGNAGTSVIAGAGTA